MAPKSSSKEIKQEAIEAGKQINKKRKLDEAQPGPSSKIQGNLYFVQFYLSFNTSFSFSTTKNHSEAFCSR